MGKNIFICNQYPVQMLKVAGDLRQALGAFENPE